MSKLHKSTIALLLPNDNRVQPPSRQRHRQEQQGHRQDRQGHRQNRQADMGNRQEHHPTDKETDNPGSQTDVFFEGLGATRYIPAQVTDVDDVGIPAVVVILAFVVL